jgi:hypothetical protein
VAELSWLFERGYAPASSLKLVGDRHALTERQRLAVFRSSCSDTARQGRLQRQVGRAAMRDQALVVDGFNVLTTVEAALGGAVILRCRDGTLRDLAGIHGTYRRVEESLPALRIVGAYLSVLGVAQSHWLLDRPVSNSGRLKKLILDTAGQEGWTWNVDLPMNPDVLLSASPEVVATADSAILDCGPRWFNLARETIEHAIPCARVIDLELHGF